MNHASTSTENTLIRLQDLSHFMESGSLDEILMQLAEMAAQIVGAKNCSIMLLNDGESDNPRMRVCANYGSLPIAAYKESTGKDEGIAGHVIATGHSLLIEDISKSPFASKARRANNSGDHSRNSLICAPVKIGARIIGVVNVNSHKNGQAFSPADVSLLDVIALFIGKSVQTSQLQNILDSRFAQLALAQEVQKNIGSSLGSLLHSPDQIARILAKSFYKEMIRAGFNSGQIVNVASGIIEQLNGNLKKHSKRAERETVPT